MDRASGSGVFARDPDALIDLIELETTEELMKQQENRAVCDACRQYLDAHFKWEDDLSQDDLCSSFQMLNYCKEKLDKWQMAALERNIEAAKARVKGMTAWRIEGTLREFPKFDPQNLWFNYPVHVVDQSGVLGDIQPDADAPSWKKNFSKKKNPEEAKKERKESLETNYESILSFNNGEKVTVKELCEAMGKSEDTIRRYIKEHGGFWITDGEVGKKQ